MTEEDKIKQVLYTFEDAGLISMDINKLMDCISDRIIGIGLGEQGFVTSKEDIKQVLRAGMKAENETNYSLDISNIHILIFENHFAVVCAKVIVTAEKNEKKLKTEFMQSLNLIKIAEDWKICGLHASTMVVTEENMEAYPLKFAEKTLESIKEQLGEKAYLIEEQYRRAILADAIAFYIINFTKDVFEKCQLNSDVCAFINQGDAYEEYIIRESPKFLIEEDRDLFFEQCSIKNVQKAFQNGENEISCEYRMKRLDGSYFWAVTIIRLITDADTSEQKGIMYVKDIDKKKKQEIEMLEKAEFDIMTKAYQKSAFIQHVQNKLFSRSPSNQNNPVFIMLDIDNFKGINDTYGHPKGDKVLLEVVRLLKCKFWSDCLVGRFGGDEFGVYVPEEHTLEQIRLAMADLFDALKWDKLGVGISCSAGISEIELHEDFEQAYSKADQTLYKAKMKGKKQFMFYTI